MLIVEGKKVPWDKEQGSHDSSTESDSRDDEGDSGSHCPHPFESEYSQILSDVLETINCLFRLSITIKNPSSHDRFMNSAATDASHFEKFDIQHVRMKFPLASESIIERLGKALSRRHQYFKYRERHHERLAHGLDEDEVDGKSTAASSLPQHLKESSTTAAVQVIDEDHDSISGFSQTSFATSAADSDRRRIVDLPKEAQEGPFPCKFCHMVVSVGSRHSWK
ncbi:hypothetical protein CPLU01_07354 [Colletotrichum plurivorum]|uniref:Uncharacterized protein n=1 Tax=Colletotrichum plurivorum TaxID=2175906 RepID=A0A8H6KFQ3_9PEZI|nr:hypothetical protein CPLU01_07354 [Colletotrichum plurivorum]